MRDWDDIRFLLAVHREGTLAGAGRSLGVDATTVGRRIAALEERLRATLFTRSRDGWRPTPEGERALAAAERAERAIGEMGRQVSGADDVPRGRVRITTIEVLATRTLVPGLPALRRRFPELRVDLVCTYQNLDLARGEADIAVRVARPTEAALLARRLGSATERPYVHRDWLAARKLAPEDVTSLDGLDVLLLLAPSEREWLEGLGEVNAVLRTNEASTLYAAAARGLGVARVPDIIAATEPDLVPLPGLGAVSERPLWLVLHRDLADVARVRAVADWLVERFAE